MWQQNVEFGLLTLPFWGFLTGASLVCGIVSLLGTRKSFRDCELEFGNWPIWSGLAGAVLSVTCIYCVLGLGTQQTPVVIPSEIGRNWRLVYHLCLVVLLVMITATDLKSYYILEWTCWLGVAIGISGAVLSGEFQLVHVWVDWNQEIPQLRGPYLPAWLAVHPHWHGLAWSVSGILAGVMLAWLTKWISSIVLGMQTLGTGDLFLMAMIGAFLGWQPTLIAFALAPVFAIVCGVVIRAVSNRPALPYGPFLALGAFTTLLLWRPIWMCEVALTFDQASDRDSLFAIRRFFGDWVSMLVAGGLALGLFVILLGMLKFYKSLDLKG